MAEEVREAWRDAILDDLDPVAATARVRSEFSESFDDSEEGAIAWTALALAQYETGRLQDSVRDRALEVIAAGADLDLWVDEDPAAASRRRRALERLEAKLRGPQPTAKRLRRSKPIVGVWFDSGDVVLVHGERGSEGLFVVVEEGNEPSVVPLLWGGGAVPSREELEQLPGLLREARARWQVPERIGPIFRVSYRVITLSRDEMFNADIGTVVARGIQRPDLTPSVPPSSFLSWPFAAAALAPGALLRQLIEDTPRLLDLVAAEAVGVHEYDPTGPTPDSTWVGPGPDPRAR
jgi:hypothetical protein